MYDTAMQFVVYGSPLMYAYLKLRCIRRVAELSLQITAVKCRISDSKPITCNTVHVWSGP